MAAGLDEHARGQDPLPAIDRVAGRSGAVYVYSGIRNVPKPWTPTVLSLKTKAEAAARTAFNSVLINRYRTGMDSMGWHADKERELGPQPVIASVSLGTTRTFDFRHTKHAANTYASTHARQPAHHAGAHSARLGAQGAEGTRGARRTHQPDVPIRGRIGSAQAPIDQLSAWRRNQSRRAHRAPIPSRRYTSSPATA